jgi:site-specific DNA-methyltransferase (adenine-specific)
MIDIRLSDNLDLMAEIKDNTVDLIYCDILYGTGRKFVDYQDLKPKREIIEEHYIPRIKEMHRVLKDTGSIYLQMDTRINHWLRCILDDIFGYDNFRTELVWLYNSQGKTNKEWNKKHDHILYYTKSKKWTFNAKDVVDSISDLTYKRFKKEIDAYGYYTVLKNGKRTKYYLENGSLPKDWHDDITYISRDNKELNGYNTQKPKALIERLVKASSNEGDLVADFYGGSFTTAEVCKDLNRNFIGCDISENAVKIGKERVKNKCVKCGRETGLKTFTYCDLCLNENDYGELF